MKSHVLDPLYITSICFNRERIWLFSYFVVTSSGTVMNSNVHMDLSITQIESALSITITDESRQYFDVYFDVQNQIVTRFADLFSCYLTTKVSTLSYIQIDIALKQAWLDKFSGTSIELHCSAKPKGSIL